MNNLVQRILTALLAGSVAVSAVFFHPIGLWVFCTIVGMVGLWEFLSVMDVRDNRYRIPVALAALAFWLMHLAP